MSTSSRRNGGRTFRPRLEVLESRTLLSFAGCIVDRLTDTGAGSGLMGDLRYCITNVTDGDAIIFAVQGTINLTAALPDLTHSISIEGTGADQMTVRRDTGGNYRIFHVSSGVNVRISGLTVNNGNTNDIGGGGIYNNGTLTVTDSVVQGNSALHSGGGILNSGMLTVSNSTISGNTAFNGGGIADIGTPTVSNSTISGNTSRSAGGGIFNNESGPVVINYTTISGNTSNGEGAGLYNYGPSMVSNSTISGNNASGGIGGGIDNRGPLGVLTITNTTVSGNTALNIGGVRNNGSLTVNNSTISGNAIGDVTNEQSMTAKNTIIGNFGGNLGSQGHNLIRNGLGGTGYDPTDLLNVDPLLGPLQDNGGPTRTMALLPGSPAIDAGDPTDAPIWDQRGPGYPRVVNGMIDIGAYEHQAVPPTITCAVADAVLWPPNHRQVNVGLSVMIDPPDANLRLLIYANDHALPFDAANIGPGTLQLRSERQRNGTGRVYLIVVTVSNSGAASFDVCTVAVPHDPSPRSIASVRQQAADATAYYQEFQTAPPGYDLLGEGPGGGGAPSSGRSSRKAIPGDIFRLKPPAAATLSACSDHQTSARMADATVPAEQLLSTWSSSSLDGYFVTPHEDGFQLTPLRLEQARWTKENTLGLDLVVRDDRLVG